MGWELGIQLVFGKLAPKARRDRARRRWSTATRPATGPGSTSSASKATVTFPGSSAPSGVRTWARILGSRQARERRRNSREFIALLDAAFATQPFAEWASRFDGEDVWWAPAQQLAEVIADPQAQAAGGFVDVDDGLGGTFRAVNSPVRFHGGGADGPRPPVPALGQHTDEILAELGLGLGEPPA